MDEQNIRSIAAKVSGSAGNLVGMAHRGGYALRTRVIPNDPLSGKQLEFRNATRDIAPSWHLDLNEVERNAWRRWGRRFRRTNKIGTRKGRDGFNAWMTINQPRWNYITDFVFDPPDLPIYGPPPIVAITGRRLLNRYQVEFPAGQPWAAPFGFIYFRASPDRDPAEERYHKKFSLTGVIAGSLPEPLSPQLLNTAFPLVQNRINWIIVVSQDPTGKPTRPIRLKVTNTL